MWIKHLIIRVYFIYVIPEKLSNLMHFSAHILILP